MKRLALVCIVVLLSSFVAISAAAQSAASATIVGTVVDPQGAVVPGAKVTATNAATGVGRTVVTTSSGNYTVPNLPPGTYSVRVEAKGFAAGETKGIILNVGDQRDLGFKLSISGATESVEVTTESPLIETTRTDVSTNVTSLDMERLPTIAGATGSVNDYAQLALTAPGVKLDSSGLTSDLIAPGSINNRGNLYNVDGANITDQLVSGRDGTGASVDEVQEFQVLTNNYNAEYGQASGLIMNVVTKSGSNGIHGDAHMYFRGRNLAASDPFYNLSFLDPTTGLVAAPQPGVPFHCPLANVGTPSISGCDRAPFHRKEGGFTLGGPFIKNKLFWFTSYELSRQAVPLILTPFGVSQQVQQPVNNLLYSGKIDYKITDNHSLSVRYAVDRFRTSNAVIQTGLNVTQDDLNSTLNNNVNLNAGFVSNVSSSMVNEARFVFTRFVTSTSTNSTAPGVIHPDGTQTGADFCCPQGGLQKRYQYIDNLTWTRGRHTMKYGFNVSYYPWFSLFPQFHFGQYTTALVKNVEVPTSFTFAIGPGEVTSKDNIYGFYAQDTWKVTNKLTLNYGLRWDYEAGAFKGGKIPGPNGTCFQGNGLISACSSDKNNFQPRVGFTYQVTNNTLLRAGFAETTMLAFNNVVLDSLNFDGLTLNTITTTDPAVLAAFPNAPDPALLTGGVACPPTCGRVRPISDHLKNPEIRMANLAVEHEFTKTFKGTIQYIGQFGFGLFGERDTNAPPAIADPAHPGFFFYGPRPNQVFGPIRTNENSRTSHYNGLLVSAEKRLSNHIQFNASYTWSHAITSSEDFFGISEPGDFVNIRPELGPAYNDIRHAVNMGVVLDSGKMTGNSFLGAFANNLGLSWVGQIQSGRPYPISTGSSSFGNGSRFFGAGSETQQRPSVLPDGTISVAGIGSFDGSNANFSETAVSDCVNAGNPAAICNALVPNTFQIPGASQCSPTVQVTSFGATCQFGPVDAFGQPVDFQLANGGLERNAGRGNAFLRFDASLHKTIGIPKYENIKVELRFDAFNVFNHANWASFNSNDVLTTLPLSLDPTCTGCQRPNGTFVGNNGQTLHLSDLRNGKVSSNLLAGQQIFNGLGDPAAVDINGIGPRKLQLSFHVRF
ncbi:MAG TPA: TonB-dependent receptor [Verrucomicrobiae bacterium]|nr:TonB-dependent receptor [Verrucomicrobiae bacterium]